MKKSERRPNGTWTRGTCGNPKGRPRKGHSLAEQLRRAVDGASRRKITRQLLKQAEGGNLDAVKLVLSYAIGPPPREPLVAIQQNFGGERGDLSKLSTAELLTLRDLVLKSQGQFPAIAAPATPEVIEAETVEVAPEVVIKEPQIETAPLEPETAPALSHKVVPIDFDMSDPRHHCPQSAYDPADPALQSNQHREPAVDLARPSPWSRDWSVS